MPRTATWLCRTQWFDAARGPRSSYTDEDIIKEDEKPMRLVDCRWRAGSRTVAVALTATAAALLLACPSIATATGDANMESCSAFGSTEEMPGFRAYLPDCRAYELVTPPYKGGWPAFGPDYGPPPMSPDGSRLLGFAFEGFANTENEEGSAGAFGALYEFSRTSSGWRAESLEPPASLSSRSQFVATNADLSQSLWELEMQSSEGEELVDVHERGKILAVREPGSGPAGQARFAEVGPIGPGGSPGPEHEGRAIAESADLTHILLSIRSEEGQLFPGDTTREGDRSLYEYVGTGNREPMLVGVKNDEMLHGSGTVNEHAELISECGTRLGSVGEEGGGSAYNAISADGAIVDFTAVHGSCSAPKTNELYARIDGRETVDISEPAMTAAREQACSGICAEEENAEGGARRSPATFQGASENGTRIFFTTEQPLLNSDKDKTTDLYMAELEGSENVKLVQVSRGDETDPTPGSGANVRGVARISEDGSHVYFVAEGVLTTRPNGRGAVAEQGAFNLYVYDSDTGHTSFVASIATHQELSEAIERLIARRECKEEFTPTEVEECEEKARGQVRREFASKDGFGQEDHRPFETTHDGQFAIFRSTRDLTAPEDTSTVPQLFEYDASTERLARVSIGQKSAAFPEGFGNDGNTANPEAAPTILEPEYAAGNEPARTASSLSLSEDGMVVFASRDALVPQAVSGSDNVYEYREGNVFLISPGDEPTALQIPGAPSRLLGADETGTDVFFFTGDNLVPQDTDTQVDWYDARIGGGFPAPSTPVGCGGEACQGPLAPPSVLAPEGGSATQASGENLAAVVPQAVPAKPKSHASETRLQKALRACRKLRGKRRRTCETKARKRYGRPSKAASRRRAKRRSGGAR
jgi:hypothetical protein